MPDIAIQGSPRSGFLPDRTVHLHLLDRCNLACAHCYSASSPTAGRMVAPDAILAALPALARAGYEVLSLSGGEPLLYPRLAEILAAGRAHGFRAVAISNGFRVAPRFDDVLDGLDLVAISFDGPEDVHNRIRGNDRAWEVAWRALTHLGARGKPSAVAYTVSTDSLAYVPDFVERAAAAGVRAVQLRPLVLAGRAEADGIAGALPPADLERLWLMGQVLGLAYSGEVRVHTDLAPAAAVAAGACAWAGLLSGRAGRLADAVNPLVLRPDGRLVPFTYDFPEAFALGSLDELGTDGGDLLQRTRALGPVVGAALEAAGRSDGMIDWFAFVRDQARLVAV